MNKKQQTKTTLKVLILSIYSSYIHVKEVHIIETGIKEY